MQDLSGPWDVSGRMRKRNRIQIIGREFDKQTKFYFYFGKHSFKVHVCSFLFLKTDTKHDLYHGEKDYRYIGTVYVH